MRKIFTRSVALSKSLLFFLVAFLSFLSGRAQDITISTYNNQSVITTYNGGSIKLTNGFNTAGHDVHIFITQDAAPVANVPTALDSAQNYIATWTATAPVSDPALLITKSLRDVKLSVQYFDGLGRPVQTVFKQGSLVTSTGRSADLVTATLYDDFGRNNSTLLPYAANGPSNGHYRAQAETEQIAWYGGDSSPVAGQGEAGANARTLTVFEPSPLNRVMESFAPGNSWLGTDTSIISKHHSTKQEYWINTAADAVRIWNVSFVTTPGSGFGSYTTTGIYPAGELYKNVTENERNREVIEFKDKEGHVVLKKVQLSATDAGSGSGHGGWLCTYYLYDDLGNLRAVIQPEGVRLLEANSWSLTNATGLNILKEQCFRYEYDGRNRMVIKQVPGAGPVYMVYDNRDRLVMTQDSLMRTSHNWLTTHYDNLNRADTTWLYNTTGSFTSILSAAADTSKYPYTAPTAATILTETHYDDYDNLPILPTGINKTYLNNWNTYFDATSTTAFPYPEMPQQNQAITTKGLVTWTRVRVLDSTLTLASVNIYDDKSRLIQTQSENITGGVDVTTTQYSWAGWPLATVRKQEEKVGAATQTSVVVTKMTYDDLGRVVKTEMKQSNSKVANGAMQTNYATLSEVGYDALGHIKQKKIGKRRSSATAYTTTPLETQDYDYNIRGWLLGVNRAYVRSKTGTDSSATATTTQTPGGEMFTESSMDVQTVTFPTTNYFGFDLGYDQRNNSRINGIPYDSARYDGNITGMTWKGAYDRKIRKYDFGYDPVNRLTGAKFGQLVGSAFSTTPVNYNVSNLTYDGNGNILTMNQYGLKTTTGSAIIDQLAYHYKAGTNKLLNVVDGANDPNSNLGDFKYADSSKTATTVDYTYDGNGNMVTDQNKKITRITYNILNLPGVITVADKGTIRYYYDAAGNKLRKRTTDITVSPSKTTVTTYIDGAVYQNDTLQFFGTPEGRMRSNSDSSGWVYDYFLKDHLGNTRMMITDDYNVASPILEASSYYPFGLQQKGIGVMAGGLLHNYKNTFQKQELNEDLGVNIYEFKYRMDDPQIGRFWQVDPLADKYEYNSTYAFSENRVINGIELEGLEWEEIIEQTEEVAPEFEAAAEKFGTFIGHAIGIGLTKLAASITLNDISPSAVSHMGPAITTVVTKAPTAATLKATAAKSASTSTTDKETGSYTNLHESGKTYSGKGDEKRSQVSGERVAKEHNDPHVATDYTPAKNNREAFKDEDTRIEKNGGHGNTDRNYNKRASPGKKYKKQDNQ